MENLTLEELKQLLAVFELGQLYLGGKESLQDIKIRRAIEQAISDKEFEEKAKPLNF